MADDPDEESEAVASCVEIACWVRSSPEREGGGGGRESRRQADRQQTDTETDRQETERVP